NEIVPHVDEAGAPRREQPFEAAAGENVHRASLEVERHGAKALYRVDDEIDAAFAAGGAESRQVDAVALGETAPRYREDLHAGLAYRAQERVLVGQGATGRQEPQFDPACLLDVLPRRHDGRELPFGRHHDVAVSEWERVRREAQAVRSVR